MQIKHSKYKNTGLLFELLVRQITTDTLKEQSSPASKILKKFFRGNSSLAKERSLYESILSTRQMSKEDAVELLNAVIEISNKLDQQSLSKQRYQLVAEIKKYYKESDFFNITVRDYKTLAATYCLLESYRRLDSVDPTDIVQHRKTVLEHISHKSLKKPNERELFIEQLKQEDRDVKLLTYRILLEKFNDKYKSFSTDQKRVLREIITSAPSTTSLRDYINNELATVRNFIAENLPACTDEVLKIKLQEVIKTVPTYTKKDKIKDSNVIQLMQYLELKEHFNKTYIQK